MVQIERYGSAQITVPQALSRARVGITSLLGRQLRANAIGQDVYQRSLGALPNIQRWLTDPAISALSPYARTGIVDAIIDRRWNDLVDAHWMDRTFGTAGVREKIVTDQESLELLFTDGIQAPILRGPNWINDLTISRLTQGMTSWMTATGRSKLLVGYDSRVEGDNFAYLVARIAIANGLTVYMFDKVSPFPLENIAITFPDILGDAGAFVSSSHNDKRYQGYKFTLADGCQLDNDTRKEVMGFISATDYSDVRLVESLDDAGPGQLIWLGGNTPVPGHNYLGRPMIDVETRHIEGMREFIIDKPMFAERAPSLVVGHAAYNGAGAEAFPRMCAAFGLSPENILPITALREINGMFPAFPLKEQPDPGGAFGVNIAVQEFLAEYGPEAFARLDALMGTDPDADRLGVSFILSAAQRQAFGSDYYLSPANLLWAALADYRLGAMARLNGGEIPNRENLYGLISQTTSPWIADVFNYYGVPMRGRLMDVEGNLLDVPKQGRTFLVGMNFAAAEAKYYRQFGYYNVGAHEESNGFSIMGGPVLPGQILGQNSWVLDKDGTFAGALTLEMLAHLKSRGVSFLDYVGEIAQRLGYYMGTWNEALPHVGQWTGPAGTARKIQLLQKADQWCADIQAGKPVVIAGKKAVSAVAYRTHQYDKELWPNSPDQGIEIGFEDGSAAIIRASGTGNNLRFYTFIKSPWERAAEIGLYGYLAEANQAATDFAIAVQKQLQREIGISEDQLE